MHILDYVLFFGSLCVSSLIGFYICCFQNHRVSTKRYYIYGDNKIDGIAIGLSLFSGTISAVVMLGIPTEIYVFGSQFMVGAISSILCIFFVFYIYIPIFCGSLKLESPYDYYELRFGTSVKIWEILIHIVAALIFFPILLNSAVMSFSELSGISLTLCTTIVGLICIIYTMIGGFITVIWTDVFQAVIMIVSYIVMMVVAIIKAGGFQEIWFRANEGGRIKFFDMNPDPFQRITFWGCIIGKTVSNVVLRSNAGAIQRYMACKSQKEAKISVLLSAIGSVLTIVSMGVIGLAMYAYYYKCDPIKNKEIKSANSLVPYFLSDIMGGVPGFTGLFIAGLLNAGLSTFSCDLNITAGVFYNDIILKIWKRTISERRGLFIMKGIVFVLGILCLALAPLFANLEYLIQIILSFGGIVTGSQGGVLLLGLLFPWANAKGAICGSLAAISLTIWINVGSMSKRVVREYILPTTVQGCDGNETILNATYSIATSSKLYKDGDILLIYKLSFMYYTLFGLIVVIVVGLIVSYFTGLTDVTKVDSRLLVPFMRKYAKTQKTPLSTNLNENAELHKLNN